MSLPRGKLQPARRILRSTVSGSACGTLLRIFFSSKLRLINEQMTDNVTDNAQMMFVQEHQCAKRLSRPSRPVSQLNFPRSRGGFLMGYRHVKFYLEILFVLQLLTTKWTFDTPGIDLRLKLSNPITIDVHCSNIPGMRHKEVRNHSILVSQCLSVP